GGGGEREGVGGGGKGRGPAERGKRGRPEVAAQAADTTATAATANERTARITARCHAQSSRGVQNRRIRRQLVRDQGRTRTCPRETSERQSPPTRGVAGRPSQPGRLS